jgi:hypothetical protein
MRFDDFATIMAMYPTTPTQKIAEEFGYSPHEIKLMATTMGIYKRGRKRAKRHHPISNLVIYNALTAEVYLQWGRFFEIFYSYKPVKLQKGWNDL